MSLRTRVAPWLSPQAQEMVRQLRGAQTPNEKPLDEGREYKVEHRTYGTFHAVILSDTATHAEVVVTRGYARRALGQGTWGIGEAFPIFKAWAQFHDPDPQPLNGGT